MEINLLHFALIHIQFVLKSHAFALIRLKTFYFHFQALILFNNLKNKAMTKKDLLTGESFEPKRKNQNFANRQNRIKYHNRKATKLRHSVAHINQPLHRNLRILNGLMEEQTTKKFHRQFLLGKGMNFNVLTHYDKVNEKNVACIYHYAISFTKDEYVLITNMNKKK